MLFLGLIKKVGNFFFENLDFTAPIWNQLSSYPGIKDIQVSEKYIDTFRILVTDHDFFQDTQYPVKYPKILTRKDTQMINSDLFQI